MPNSQAKLRVQAKSRMPSWECQLHTAHWGCQIHTPNWGCMPNWGCQSEDANFAGQVTIHWESKPAKQSMSMTLMRTKSNQLFLVWSYSWVLVISHASCLFLALRLRYQSSFLQELMSWSRFAADATFWATIRKWLRVKIISMTFPNWMVKFWASAAWFQDQDIVLNHMLCCCEMVRLASMWEPVLIM